MLAVTRDEEKLNERFGIRLWCSIQVFVFVVVEAAVQLENIPKKICFRQKCKRRRRGKTEKGRRVKEV